MEQRILYVCFFVKFCQSVWLALHDQSWGHQGNSPLTFVINNTDSFNWRKAKYRNAFVGAISSPLSIPSSQAIKEYLDLKQFTFMATILVDRFFFAADNAIIMGDPNRYALGLEVASGNLQAWIHNCGKKWIGSTPVVLQRFQHVVLSYDGQIIKLYINAVLKATHTCPGSRRRLLDLRSFIFGQFPGTIEDVSIHNR